jgi:hypothetical protein
MMLARRFLIKNARLAKQEPSFSQVCRLTGRLELETSRPDCIADGTPIEGDVGQLSEILRAQE